MDDKIQKLEKEKETLALTLIFFGFLFWLTKDLSRQIIGGLGLVCLVIGLSSLVAADHLTTKQKKVFILFLIGVGVFFVLAFVWWLLAMQSVAVF